MSKISIPARLFFIFTAVLTIVVVGNFFWHPHATTGLGGDFTLNHSGEPWHFADHARELNLLYIGYVNCPDVCPLRMSRISQALKSLTEAEQNQILPIFISVDVEHDDPTAVAEYARHFGPSFVGLTGPTPELNEVVTKFGATYSKNLAPDTQLGYTYMHTDRVFFLNQQGQVLESLVAPATGEEILLKLREYL
jgi:protein SCO1/2